MGCAAECLGLQWLGPYPYELYWGGKHAHARTHTHTHTHTPNGRIKQAADQDNPSVVGLVRYVSTNSHKTVMTRTRCLWKKKILRKTHTRACARDSGSASRTSPSTDRHTCRLHLDLGINKVELQCIVLVTQRQRLFEARQQLFEAHVVTQTKVQDVWHSLQP